MLGLVFAIAVVNLCLGYLLACRIGTHPRLVRLVGGCSFSSDLAATGHALPADDETVRAESSANGAAHSTVEDAVMSSVSATDGGAVVPPEGFERAPEPRSWDEFGRELSGISERLEYVRRVEDKGLAQKIAEQIEGCVRAWFSEVEQRLEAEIKKDPNSDAVMHLELCLAQLETTLTNLSMTDWSLPLEEITARLQKELDVLDQTQKQAIGAGSAA